MGPAAPQAVERALTSAEGMLQLLRALRVPPPLPDGLRGGSPALDIYLVPGARAVAHAEGVPTAVSFDRASAFATLPPWPDGPECAFESAVARVVAQAALLGIDAAAGDGILAAQSSWLAELSAPCAPLALAALDEVQRRPDVSIADGDPGALAGEMLWSWFLDDAYGTGRPGAVMTALVATSCQRTANGASRYEDEPDVFDALRAVLPEREKTLGDLLLELAVARAFMGDRSDGAHLVGSEWLGPLGRVRFEWALRWADLPKRVAPTYALEPTGAAYYWLDLRDAPPGAGVLFVADWEATHVFQWALVLVDGDGREIARHVVGGVFGEEQTSFGLRDLAGAAALLIVGTHLGGDDRSKPYDPDEGGSAPGGYTVTLHPE